MFAVFLNRFGLQTIITSNKPGLPLKQAGSLIRFVKLKLLHKNARPLSYIILILKLTLPMTNKLSEMSKA